jgi:SAF domain
MAMTERGLEAAPQPHAVPRGFRPVSRRRARLAAGAALAAVGIGGNVLLYTSLDDSVEVVQMSSNVRAGQQITTADLRIVEVDVDASVPVVTADRIGAVVGQYATVYIAAGTLMVDVLVQPTPLVAPGRSVVAIELRPTQVPDGLLERSRVQLIVVGDDAPIYLAEGRVVSIVGTDANGDEEGSMSFEVDAVDAPALAAARDVRVVLLDPGDDPALPPAGMLVPAATAPAVTVATTARPTRVTTTTVVPATVAPAAPPTAATGTAPATTGGVAP